jgi:hypothetical protein
MLCLREGPFAELTFPVKGFLGADRRLIATSRSCVTSSGMESGWRHGSSRIPREILPRQHGRRGYLDRLCPRRTEHI